MLVQRGVQEVNRGLNFAVASILGTGGFWASRVISKVGDKAAKDTAVALYNGVRRRVRARSPIRTVSGEVKKLEKKRRKKSSKSDSSSSDEEQKNPSKQKSMVFTSRNYARRRFSRSSGRSSYKRYPRRNFRSYGRKRNYAKVMNIMSQVERKTFDNYFIDYPVTQMTAGTSIWSLSDIPQGVTDIQRVGNKITCEKIYGYISLTLPINAITLLENGTPSGSSSLLPNHVCVRIMIFQWFELDSRNAPTDNQLFQVPANDLCSLHSPPDRERHNEFWTLYDKTVWLTSLNTSCWTDYISIKPKRKAIQFTTTNAGLNKIYMKIWYAGSTQSNILLPAALPVANINLRVNFYDV